MVLLNQSSICMIAYHGTADEANDTSVAAKSQADQQQLDEILSVCFITHAR
jgi:hypothetical protein